MLDANIQAQLDRWKKERDTRATWGRMEMLMPLRLVGVTEIRAYYDALGDSGNVEEIDITPKEIIPSHEFEMRLRDFLWDTVYALHPGFENNDGGFGDIKWDL